MKIGYSFWGFLGDTKYDKYGKQISTPDGNAFYSWSIIKELQRKGNEVSLIMPDRDRFGYEIEKRNLFSSWIKLSRNYAYSFSDKILYPDNISNMSEDDVYRLWDQNHLDASDLILHEWRMEIPGRNDNASKSVIGASWQPDLFIQNCLIEYCSRNKIKLVIFDLDYKLSESTLEDICKECNVSILELGSKWSKTKLRSISKQVYIPFDFKFINFFRIKDDPENNLIYVGNRYERDWCIDKYIPENLDNTIVYGNWNESGRDSASRWPNINFGHRLQTKEMYEVYSNSVATILLAKEDYCKYGFMTARIIESIFYGTVPLFIEEYGENVIREFAGAACEELIVRNKNDVIDKINKFKNDKTSRKSLIMFLRMYLQFMDVEGFVNILFSTLEA